MGTDAEPKCTDCCCVDVEPVVRDCALFENVCESHCAQLLKTLGASVRSYEEGDLLLRLGDMVSRMGIVVEGMVEIGFYDETGELATVSRIAAGGIFAESIACAAKPRIVQATAIDRCRVLWLDVSRLLASDVLSCNDGAATVVANLVRIVSRKNIFLNQKAQILTQRYVRDRIKLYLKDHLDRERLSVPYSRIDLARYLGVNRSALSRELGRLRDEGIVCVEDGCLVVLQPDFLCE